MDKTGQPERKTQNRIVKLFEKELDYDYLGDWQDRENNSNIEEDLLSKYLVRKGYSPTLITKAIHDLKSTASIISDSLYDTNKKVYEKIRYGSSIKEKLGDNSKRVHFIDWENFGDNDFAIAEEVSINGQNPKRPDIVIYVNGIALGVIELKRAIVDIGEGIRQNITNQQPEFIQSFFTTIQFCFAGNDTEGLRYGTIGTPEQYYLSWKEDVEDNSRLTIDKYILKMCRKDRFLEIIYDYVLFDGGIKKLPRVHQYFGVKAAQDYVNRYEGGIIWHSQGSGKSLTMVWLAKWILENNSNARIAVITDRDELDKQIEDVFTDAGEEIYRTSSGRDLMHQLGLAKPRMLCSLIHKFGKKDEKNFKQFIKELEENPIKVTGELFCFVDECHRTQSGKLHKTMKAMLPNAVFIGFTGTPLLKKDKKTSLEVFGRYIHTYLFNEGVADRVILDLVYEARDINQKLSSQKKIDKWFKAKTRGLNEFQRSVLKKKWGTMQNVLSSKSRMSKIVADITFDFNTKPLLSSERGNAILIANSIYEACEYYKLFQLTEFKGKCAVVTSYNPHTSDITTEDTGANTETQKQSIYKLYEELLKDVKPQPNKTKTESYEDWAKLKFKKEPVNMKLLIVVSKLLVGFDAPSCCYLYIDKSMQDHNLFQALCRANRLDGDDKDYGYIVDYRDLFEKVGEAIAVYTSELDTEDFDLNDIQIMLNERLKLCRERLDNALEEIALLCEHVPLPKSNLDYIHYFCGNPEKSEDLKANEAKRTTLYKKTVALIRAYANIADDMEEAGYSIQEIEEIKKEVDFYVKLREEIKKASGETLDLKTYEADMRHLIDTYIEAKDPKKISSFEDMSLLEIVEKAGIAEAINSLPKGIKSSQESIAETIENNVRKKIITDHLIDPEFFKKMSVLLDALIKQRKAKAITYKEYLKRIAELAKNTNKGKSSDTPDSLKTQGARALYNNLGKDEALAVKLDAIIKKESPADWRDSTVKEKTIKGIIFNVLAEEHEGEPLDKLVSEPPAGYGLASKVELVFKILKENREY